MAYTLELAAAFLALLSTARALLPVEINYPSSSLDSVSEVGLWSSLTPTENLNFTSCHGEYLCARLLLPLDYNNWPANNNTVAVAIVVLPAIVPHNDSSFGGTIFTNPGGPGGSGVDLVLHGGKQLRKIVDDTKHYDILSFDPRAVGLTTPGAHCFLDEFAEDLFAVEEMSMGAVSYGGTALINRLAASKAHGLLCNATDVSGYKDGSNIRNHLGTASVARDMLEIAKQLEHAQAFENGENGSADAIYSDEVKLQYWGISYGTHLGNTFASLFPRNVGRMILDGVMDSPKATEINFFNDTHSDASIADYFYESCFAAKSKCRFYSNDTSSEAIRARVENMRAKLSETPLPVVTNHNPKVVTADVIEWNFVGAGYSPARLFPELAASLAILEEVLEGRSPASGSGLADRVQSECKSSYSYSQQEPSLAGDQDMAMMVLCGDSVQDFSKFGAGYLQEYSDKCCQMLPATQDICSSNLLACMGYPIRAAAPFFGPYQTPEPGTSDGPSAPLLFLSSRYDPITPLDQAYAMSRTHPGSAVVVQESYGHSSFSGSSECTYSIVKMYFAQGIVPANDTSCSVPVINPFTSPESEMPYFTMGQRWNGLN